MQRQTASNLALRWTNEFRILWEQHVMWTRAFLISKAENLGDLDLVTKRLLRNPKDFTQALSQFYGDKAMGFAPLLTEHLTTAAELVDALQKRDMRKADDARRRWYDNADKIARFLAALNEYWDQRAWQRMLFAHLQTTEREAALRLSKQYAADIQIYDAIEAQALEMADMMSNGLIRAFSL